MRIDSGSSYQYANQRAVSKDVNPTASASFSAVLAVTTSSPVQAQIL